MCVDFLYLLYIISTQLTKGKTDTASDILSLPRSVVGEAG